MRSKSEIPAQMLVCRVLELRLEAARPRAVLVSQQKRDRFSNVASANHDIDIARLAKRRIGKRPVRQNRTLERNGWYATLAQALQQSDELGVLRQVVRDVRSDEAEKLSEHGSWNAIGTGALQAPVKKRPDSVFARQSKHPGPVGLVTHQRADAVTCLNAQTGARRRDEQLQVRTVTKCLDQHRLSFRRKSRRPRVDDCIQLRTIADIHR